MKTANFPVTDERIQISFRNGDMGEFPVEWVELEDAREERRRMDDLYLDSWSTTAEGGNGPEVLRESREEQ